MTSVLQIVRQPVDPVGKGEDHDDGGDHELAHPLCPPWGGSIFKNLV